MKIMVNVMHVTKIAMNVMAQVKKNVVIANVSDVDQLKNVQPAQMDKYFININVSTHVLANTTLTELNVYNVILPLTLVVRNLVSAVELMIVVIAIVIHVTDLEVISVFLVLA